MIDVWEAFSWIEKEEIGTSLLVQLLRLCTLKGVWVWSLVGILHAKWYGKKKVPFIDDVIMYTHKIQNYHQIS